MPRQLTITVSDREFADLEATSRAAGIPVAEVAQLAITSALTMRTAASRSHQVEAASLGPLKCRSGATPDRVAEQIGHLLEALASQPMDENMATNIAAAVNARLNGEGSCTLEPTDRGFAFVLAAAVTPPNVIVAASALDVGVAASRASQPD